MKKEIVDLLEIIEKKIERALYLYDYENYIDSNYEVEDLKELLNELREELNK
jgi:hypothetical protein